MVSCEKCLMNFIRLSYLHQTLFRLKNLCYANRKQLLRDTDEPRQGPLFRSPIFKAPKHLRSGHLITKKRFLILLWCPFKEISAIHHAVQWTQIAIQTAKLHIRQFLSLHFLAKQCCKQLSTAGCFWSYCQKETRETCSDMLSIWNHLAMGGSLCVCHNCQASTWMLCTKW